MDIIRRPHNVMVVIQKVDERREWVDEIKKKDRIEKTGQRIEGKEDREKMIGGCLSVNRPSFSLVLVRALHAVERSTIVLRIISV